MARASDNDALPAFSAKNKSGFDDGHDRKPFGMSQHISWNCFLRHLSEIANDRRAVLDNPLFGSARSDEREE
jgi:hypothetical protein